MSAAIELRGVEKRFGDISIIRNISLSVAQGERHALIGPNGAGKSTTFNLISGYMAPSAGSVLLRGNTFEKGPRSENHTSVVAIGSEGVNQPTPSILADGNVMPQQVVVGGFPHDRGDGGQACRLGGR